MRKLFYLFILSILIVTSCSENSFIQTELNNDSNIKSFSDQLILTTEGEVQNTYNFEAEVALPICLDTTLIDTFIYYANEFTNYLWTEDNQPLLLDSLELLNLANNADISSLSEFYLFVSTNFDIPIEVIEGFSVYSAKILPQLEREYEEYHPIASRYYQLIKSDCLISIFPDEMFEEDELQTILRVKCGFWNLFASCAGLAASAAGAVMVETWTLGIGTGIAIGLVASAYSYGSAIADCL